jgi:hypothetical protein
MAENTLERYRQDARDLLTAHDPRIRERPMERLEAFGIGDFEDAICALVQRYVAHDMEWAALAVEAAIAAAIDRMGEVGRASEAYRSPFIADVRRVVASIRERGRAA